MEIITGVERRRQWPLERKLAVLEEAARSSERAASFARRHDIRPQQLYRWRRELREGRLDEAEPAAPTFLPVSLADREEPEPLSRQPERRRGKPRSRIEIVLGNGRMLRVDAGIEEDDLRR
ncbi:MAG TPA: transposase, partial [Woeseiaceae bacterium]|nr:transposase [Woeseiaceae bacterium]